MRNRSRNRSHLIACLLFFGKKQNGMEWNERGGKGPLVRLKDVDLSQ